jgi:hypothetical protein
MNIKFFIIFFIASHITIGSTWAQIPVLSLRGGLNFSSIGGENSEDAKIKPGFHLGIFGSMPITKTYSLKSGLSFSLKGARTTTDSQITNYNLHYLDIPILARKNILPYVNLIAGPQISYLLGSRTRIKDNGQILIEGSTEGLYRLDLGIHLGADYDMQNQLSVGLGFDWGLLSLDKEGNSKTYNRVFKLTLAYQLE